MRTCWPSSPKSVHTSSFTFEWFSSSRILLQFMTTILLPHVLWKGVTGRRTERNTLVEKYWDGCSVLRSAVQSFRDMLNYSFYWMFNWNYSPAFSHQASLVEVVDVKFVQTCIFVGFAWIRLMWPTTLQITIKKVNLLGEVEIAFNGRTDSSKHQSITFWVTSPKTRTKDSKSFFGIRASTNPPHVLSRILMFPKTTVLGWPMTTTPWEPSTSSNCCNTSNLFTLDLYYKYLFFQFASVPIEDVTK